MLHPTMCLGMAAKALGLKLWSMLLRGDGGCYFEVFIGAAQQLHWSFVKMDKGQK